jgi:hypothetical protein
VYSGDKALDQVATGCIPLPKSTVLDSKAPILGSKTDKSVFYRLMHADMMDVTARQIG